MRFRKQRKVAAALAVLLAVASAGCDDIDWVTVVEDSGTPRAYRWRGNELWTVGQSVHHRTSDGTWETLDVCGQYGGGGATTAEIDVAFVDGDVWALCAIPFGNKALIHYVHDEGTVIDVPTDGELSLVDTRDSLVLAGETSLHRFDAGAWIAYAPYAVMMTDVHAAGLAADDIYATTNGSIMHWDGATWSDVPLAGTTVFGWPTLRGGKVRYGNFTLEGGALIEPKFSNALWKNIELRALGLGAVLPNGHGFFGQLGDGLHLWEADPDDDDVSWLGDGPFVAGSWNAGGGIANMVGIDEHTVLIVYSSGAGINAGVPTDNLIEGRL